MKKSDLPKYVMLGQTEMRLKEDEYWRNAGLWGVNYKIKNGKLFSDLPDMKDHGLHNVELIPITEEEWRKGNEGYV